MKPARLLLLVCFALFLGCHAKRVLPKASSPACSRAYPSGALAALDGTATLGGEPVASVEDCEIPHFFAPDPPNWGTTGWLSTQFLSAPVHGTNYGSFQFWSYLAVYFVVPPYPPVAPSDTSQNIGFFPAIESAPQAFYPRILQPVLYYGNHGGTLGWWVTAILNQDSDPSAGPQQNSPVVQVHPGDGLVGLIRMVTKFPDNSDGHYVYEVSIQPFNGLDGPGNPAITQMQFSVVSSWLPNTISPMALESQSVPVASCGLLPGNNAMGYAVLGMGIPQIPNNPTAEFTDGNNSIMVAGFWNNDGSYTDVGSKRTGGCSADSVYRTNPSAPWNGSLTWNASGSP